MKHFLELEHAGSTAEMTVYILILRQIFKSIQFITNSQKKNLAQYHLSGRPQYYYVSRKDSLQSAKEISWKQHAILEFIQLCPVIIVCGTLQITNDGLTTLVAFLSFLITAPLIYCKMFNKDLKSTFACEIGPDPRYQTKKWLTIGLTLCALDLVIYFSIYYNDVSIQQAILQSNIPLKKDAILAGTFFFLFAFVNPVVEDLFWRLFLGNCYPKALFYDFLTTFNYGLYHGVVLSYLFKDNWMLILSGTLSISFLGGVFVYLKEKYGVIAIIYTHFGMDFVVGVMYCHLIFELTAKCSVTLI